MSKKNVKMCCIDGCTEPEKARGLCRNHYQSALRQVETHKTTWDELVGLGLAFGKSGHRRDGTFAALIDAARQLRDDNETKADVAGKVWPACYDCGASRDQHVRCEEDDRLLCPGGNMGSECYVPGAIRLRDVQAPKQ